MRKATVALVAAIGAALATGGAAAAATLSPGLETLLSRLGDEDRVPVIVRFGARSPRGRAATPVVRGSRPALIRSLRAAAEESQRPARAYLQARGLDGGVSLWLINALAVTLPAGAVRALADLPGVERVDHDHTLAEPRTTTAPAARGAFPPGTPASPGMSFPSPASAGVEWNLSAIRATEVWDLGYRGAGVVVATLDSGVDVEHQDLAGRWRGGGNSWFDPTGRHPDPHDHSGHGTQAMGLIVGGGAGGTAIGVAPEATWIAVKIFDDSGQATFGGIHQGFQWVLDPDGDAETDDAADIVNNSWGVTEAVGECLPEFDADILALRAAGIAMAFSAGNEGPLPGTSLSPANGPGGFAVGALDTGDLVADFSSRGPSACGEAAYPHVVVPGSDLRTSDLTFGGVFPDAYTYATGTSYAAPHVAGGMALLAGAFPAATVEAIEAALTGGARDLDPPGPDADSGHGVVDLAVAFDLLRTGAGCPDGDGDARSWGGGACGAPDCDDGDPELWGTPGECRSLVFDADHRTLSWLGPFDAGATADAIRFDVLRTDEPGDFVGGALCLESDDASDGVATDAGIPPPGRAFYYLARAENSCPEGTGSLGTDSGGVARTGRTCEALAEVTP